MKFLRAAIFVSIALLQFSCKNDLKLNAPYKEIPTVYAILNPYEPEQVIRINKVFLGEGDANQMAKVADSINYPEKELTVSLERYVNGQRQQVAKRDPAKTIIFLEKIITALPGSFSQQQRVYYYPDSLFPDGEFRLTIKNNRTGNVFTSKSKGIERVEFSFFSPLNSRLGFPYDPKTDPNSPYYIDYSLVNGSTPYDVRYLINDAYIYQLVIRLVIKENSAAGEFDRFIDYNAGTKTLDNTLKLPGNVATYVQHTFKGGGIFDAVATELSKDKYTVYWRKLYRMDYYVYSSNHDYFDYLEYQKPSLSINQNKPLYSNFDNSAALGIFAIRTSRMVSLQPKATYVSAFSDNPSTCRFNFYDFSDKIRGCR